MSSTAVTDSTTDGASVLVAEDEQDLANLYTEYLTDTYDVTTVYSGEEAVETLGEGFDVVLLDRRMPVVSGSEVLAAIEEQNLHCRVAMVTAINPDFEIIDLRIDEYLVKPVTRDELRTTVERLLRLDEYDQRMQELTSKKLKRNVLEVEKTRAELEGTPEFVELTDEIEHLEAELDAIAEDLDPASIERQL